MSRQYQQTLQLVLGSEEVAVHIQASRRKSMRLSLTDKGAVDLRIPLRAPRSEVLAFVKRHEQWLLQQRQRLAQQQQRWQQAIMVLGRELPVSTSPDNEFLVAEQRIWVPAQWQASDIATAMDAWFRQQAKSRYQGLIEHWWPAFAQFGDKPVLRVKKMRTRWGSLSKRGYINLNLALMQCAPDLIELVVVHELCHLRYFDHGRGFQQLMTQHLPDWQQRERRLQQQGSMLL
ncbi:metal-dependent hydrolase [Bacterioplanes sanyensis]|uniref:M48 family metallopeptidase n=1 Tax=Bacterioplanes sanyensis TaxID=1249553 RepID=UPI0016775B32|nr:YgjP-like metallopeptidase domain-containing protein [Bacterioplanes sanyensis]GGY32780.1 metal-dependent hydrolase [Bacterioplanes sanyensis]